MSKFWYQNFSIFRNDILPSINNIKWEKNHELKQIDIKSLHVIILMTESIMIKSSVLNVYLDKYMKIKINSDDHLAL